MTAALLVNSCIQIMGKPRGAFLRRAAADITIYNYYKIYANLFQVFPKSVLFISCHFDRATASGEIYQ